MVLADRRRRTILLVAGIVFLLVSGLALTQSPGAGVSQLIANGTFVAVGAVIALRRPGNVIGPLMVAVGLIFQISITLLLASEAAIADGDLDRAGWLALIAEGPVGNLGIAMVVALVFLFPNGRTESVWNRRLLGGALLLSVLAIVLSPLAAPSAFDGEPETLPHPFLDDATATSNLDLLEPLMIALGALMLVAAGMLVARMRRAGPVERRQIGWLAAAVAGYGLILVPALTLNATGDLSDEAFLVADAIGFTLIPIALGVAIMRYRLYDIDIIISKSVVYLGLLAAVTAVYALIVLVPLLVIGASDDGGPGLLLPIVATAVVAVLFEPIRSRMQRWANRLVYGNRSTPHQVLSQVTSRLGESEGTDTDDLARLIAEGTGAEQAVVWLDGDDGLAVVGNWSVNGSDPRLPIEDDERSEVVGVLHEAERLGAVSITKPGNDAITPADRELLDDVAAGAALLLRNIRLNKELEDRAAQVRDSRRRLIEAQDEERHRLERDLHDGAQQQVVALKVKLGIAKTIAEREKSDEIAARLVALADETQEAVDALRAVAHGIYPPLLESEGLEPALRAVERTSALPIELDAAHLERYGRSTEATVYFCVTETLERARMSGATRARVEVAGRNGDLITRIDLGHVEAELDLRAVADRLDAAGGTLSVEDEPERGRHVVGSLPLVPIDRAAP